jgi:mono/diheme cytochrome c family protein
MLRLIVVLAVLAALFVAWRTLKPQLPAAERGRRLAQSFGCFGCHGPDGTRGIPNHGRTDKTVPTFEGDVMMYAKSDAEIREWIMNGGTARRWKSETWRQQRERGAVRMPAFRDRLSATEIDELVAFVHASAGEEIPDSLAKRGLERMEQLGCTGCHGPGGRLALRNPGSLKGYIPSWDGADFPDLVRDSTEFRQWVEHGMSRRFESNPLARYFVHRALVHMPAFERHLEPEDVPAMWGYIRYLRRM